MAHSARPRFLTLNLLGLITVPCPGSVPAVEERTPCPSHAH